VLRLQVLPRLLVVLGPRLVLALVRREPQGRPAERWLEQRLLNLLVLLLRPPQPPLAQQPQPPPQGLQPQTLQLWVALMQHSLRALTLLPQPPQA